MVIKAKKKSVKSKKVQKKQSEDHTVPSDQLNMVDTSEWPLLLKNFHRLNIKSTHYTPIPSGSTPQKRSLVEYLKYAVINLDKPSNPSSHEIVAWVKRILKVEKTGHSGTLDPKVTGCLIVCINRATRLAKAQQGAGKEYVCVLKLHDSIDSKDALLSAMDKLTGPVFQKPPAISAVKKKLRVRNIYKMELFQFCEESNSAVFWCSVEAGSYIRTLCVHLGLLLGVEGSMDELRRVRSGIMDENSGLYTMHDILDAQYQYEREGNDAYLRKIIQPLECLLTNYPRIVLKDSAVNSICYGGKLLIPGVLRYSSKIEVNKEVVMMTAKGEAIAMGIALMTPSEIYSCDHGIVVKIKRVIMDKDLYPKRWKKGPRAQRKQNLIKLGLLDPKGRPTPNTPQDWISYYIDETNNNIVAKEENAEEKVGEDIA